MLIAVVFFLFASMTVIMGIINPILKQAAISKNNIYSKESYYLAEGSLEDVIYRLKNGKQVSSIETISLNNVTATTTTSNTTEGKQVVSIAEKNTNVRKTQANVALGTGVSFNFGVQAGNGGFILENSSTVTGNVYSNGTITGSGNTISGDAISADPIGLINNIHTTGSSYAHTIQNSNIDLNAYYVVKTNTTVGGTSYPYSSDQPSADMPISDDQIDEFKNDALAGGVATCSGGSYKITTTSTLGPKKIPCDLEISGSPTITLNGHIWVTGNITIQNSAIIRIASNLGSNSVAIIADKTNDRIGSSQIQLKNSVQFFGSGSVGSFIFLMSRNNSAEVGSSDDAIEMDNSSSGAVILYAPHGLISINNSAILKEVTGYKIKAKNTANIIYDTGLANTLFTSGPGGGYTVLNWGEI